MLDREVVLPGESIVGRIEHEDDNADVALLLGADLLLEEVFPFRGGEYIDDRRHETVLASAPGGAAAGVSLLVPPDAPASSVVVSWRVRASIEWQGRERVVEADLTVLEPEERVAGWSSVVDPRDPAWPRSGSRIGHHEPKKVRAPWFWKPADSQEKHGAVSIAAEPSLLAPGQRLTGTMSVTPPEDSKFSGVSVYIGYVVAGLREPESWVGSEEFTSFPQDHVVVTGGSQRESLSLAAGERKEFFPFELELPEGMPPTSRSPNAMVRWYLMAWLPMSPLKGYGGLLPIGVYTALRQ